MHFLTRSPQTTASDSALVAIVAARSIYSSKHPSVKLEDMIIYTTTQTHSLGVKAALVLGLQCRALEVTAEDRFALRGATLQKALAEDQNNGKHPFVLGKYDILGFIPRSWSQMPYAVVATVGTTSSGAIDRLDEIGEVGKCQIQLLHRPILIKQSQGSLIVGACGCCLGRCRALVSGISSTTTVGSDQ